MRLLAALALVSLSGPAFAGSVDTVTSLPKGKGTESVMAVACPACSSVPAEEKETGYKVPELDHGKQKVEVKTINGEQKLVRTEAWLGGSPVVFVTAATPEIIASYFPAKDQPSGDGIDQSSKTAAVEKAPAEPKALDTGSFTLRTE